MINGLKHLTRNVHEPAIVIPLWFPITLTHTIVTASGCIGFALCQALPGDPGSF